MTAALAELLADNPRDDLSFWKTVVDTMDEALIVVDPDRNIVYSNRKAEALTGQSLSQCRGEPCVDAISCPQCACVCRLFEEGSLEGVAVTVYDPRDGTPRVFLKHGQVLRDATGRVIGGVETFSDVTGEVRERRDKERRIELLFHEKKRTEALIDSLSEGVASLDATLRILSFSQRLSEITGHDASEATGKSFLELLGLDDTVQLPTPADGSSHRRIRAQIRRRDRTLRPVELIFRPVRFSDGEILVLVRDLAPAEDTPRGAEATDTFHGIITRSEKMRPVLKLIEHVAASEANVLIEGESGAGKELVARAVHRMSPRRDEPFYAVNCATFTGSLLLSELFGHERGAFTGAIGTQRGKLELAGRGTLFLDEVSEIPLEHQALLLRVLEERTFERVGGHVRIDMNARIIAATNRDLDDLRGAGQFRDDLYYRLRVVPIRVPPLRDRAQDVALLARVFLARAAGTHARELSPEALELLTAYPWPGNVRELRNVIEYLCCVSSGEITADDLPPEIRAGSGRTLEIGRPPARISDDDERARIHDALRQTRFHRGHAAELLGIDRTTLWRKMRRLGIE
jgi:PAS domain S-box-containing protein